MSPHDVNRFLLYFDLRKAQNASDNELRIQKFQYFIENILPKYDRWNFTVSLSKKYEIVSEQLLQEVKSKTQIEFQRTQELIDSAFTKLANSSNASTESNINTIKTILENYLDSNKEEQEELKKQFIQKQNLDRLLAQYNTTLKELDEFKEQVKKLKKEKSRLNSLDHHKINILNGDKLNLIALFDEFMKANNENGETWNSGKKESDQILVTYPEKNLQPFTKYYWKVNVWDKDGKKASSDINSFETGMMGMENWQGAWIGDNRDINYKPAPYFRKTFDTQKKVK